MIFTAGVDVGSTYTKAVILSGDDRVVGRSQQRTGFRLAEAAEESFRDAIASAGIARDAVKYVISTGYGRMLVPFRDLQVTDLTAGARGAAFFFPSTRTVLDVGGQTVKASRLDDQLRVTSFRLNDKCAAGTGAFLEKTARYLGYKTEEIGPLAAMSRQPVPISGVCAVFAESEVINHLSQGTSPGDIMLGAISSLVDRSVQLLRRVRMEPEFTLVGGILRFPSMVSLLKERLGAACNVPPEDMVQFVAAIGGAVLARRRLQQLASAADSFISVDARAAAGRTPPPHAGRARVAPR